MKGWEYKKAKELVTFRTGKLDSNAAETEGKYPFFTCAQETFKINSYAFDTECVLLAGNNAAGIFPLKYYKGKFNAYQRTYIIEPKGLGLLNIRFLYESFKPFLKQFEQTSTGATTKFLTMGILNNLWLPLPPLPIQRKIAAVLSAYDDLIENNNRRIAILEKMAEELYREWFVRLRFPGHEKVRIVKGVPEGWEVKRVKDIGKVVTGKTPSTAIQKYHNGNVMFIKTPDMHNNMFVFKTEETLTEEGMNSQSSQTLPVNSICVSCIGTGGIVAITTSKCQTNQQINSVIPESEEYVEWAYFTLVNLKDTIRLFGSTGTTMTNLSKGKFADLKIYLPSSHLIKDFHVRISPIFKEIKHLSKIQQGLKDSRDRLLSRLMSGKIDVERLDIKFPASMMEEDRVGRG